LVELNEQTYARLQLAAANVGTSPDHLAALTIQREYGRPHMRQSRSSDEARTAADRFERHFGSVDVGYPTGIDNDLIDADLSREYAAHAEEQ
jgi:hypothetical protein